MPIAPNKKTIHFYAESEWHRLLTVDDLEDLTGVVFFNKYPQLGDYLYVETNSQIPSLNDSGIQFVTKDPDNNINTNIKLGGGYDESSGFIDALVQGDGNMGIILHVTGEGSNGIFLRVEDQFNNGLNFLVDGDDNAGVLSIVSGTGNDGHRFYSEDGGSVDIHSLGGVILLYVDTNTKYIYLHADNGADIDLATTNGPGAIFMDAGGQATLNSMAGTFFYLGGTTPNGQLQVRVMHPNPGNFFVVSDDSHPTAPAEYFRVTPGGGGGAGTVMMPNLPTSSAGLSAGALYSSGGFVRIA